ncbi:RNA polymerase II C-terminal domain phosphatase component [Plenodomus tracheiphilus IPT5]|uniref:RNA polymerase II subunit A C-terminal domain phosphatase n=1 Tax=Plenodomus tracheiphilus IPT5 TaxID=1408161 RepID=A0A6A7BE69_9PLEO|nr:RNA polymerase II C-terminal domain phosphatase component [Plenodomus tracheiphilus IPT5]
MKVFSPRDLAYPITIVDLLKQSGELVKRSEKLFSYRYQTEVTEGDKWGGWEKKKVSLITKHDASAEGKVTRWLISPGTVIDRMGIGLVEIEEACTHETQFGGLCAECGEDMTKIDYLTKERDVTRATINTTHDNVALLVSRKEAEAAEEDAKKRLLGAKKLTLIVDLDQTVIHTTCERTIAEWKEDPENPNHAAVKDVEGFQLADDNVSNVAANWYYVKMRPGLKDFFNRMSKLYEMHVYTMATRAYAQAVCKIIDPDRRYFGDRILSRDENYTDKTKSLSRLFQNTTMVVIIDDRADVWQYSPHLVRVPVFNFFPGAGDINASFLPKQQELVSFNKDKLPPTPKKSDGTSLPTVSVAGQSVEPAPVAVTNGDLKDIGEKLVTLAKKEDLEVQAKEQQEVIIAQQTERPLLQQQLLQDKEDEAAEDIEAAGEVENGNTQHADHHKVRHSILNDDDRGLDIIEQNLLRVHREFYDQYVRSKAVPAGGRIAELKGEKSPKKRAMNDVIPDVAEIMPRIKSEVLDGAVVVFSGIIPLGVDVQSSDFALWIMSFGAEVSTSVNRRITHVIANPDRKTTKVKSAARYPHIKIVNPEWMFQCCTRWEHVDEGPYIIEMDAAEREGSPLGELDDESISATGDEEVDEAEEATVRLDAMTADSWASVDDELADFLNESETDGGSDSDSESVRSDISTTSDAKQQKKKRKRSSTNSTDVSDTEDSDSSVTSTSRLQRRKKRTLERVTSLANVVSADKSSGLPSPETTGPEEGQGGDDDDKAPDVNGNAPDLQDDYDDGLEAELLAGFDDSDGDD